jgi:uncharacterized membrane protein
MIADIDSWLDAAWRAASFNHDWIPGNLFLASVPLVLSIVLFRWKTRRGPLWWIGVGAFVVFLPNAPYVLTDIIHLFEQARFVDLSVTVLVLVPLYGIVIFLAFEAYVVSLLNVGEYLRAIGRSRLVLPAEVGLSAACAVGIYLGRVERFNSWAVATRLNNLAGSIIDNGLERRPVALIVVTFVALLVLYGIAKWLTLAALEYGLGSRSPFPGHRLRG